MLSWESIRRVCRNAAVWRRATRWSIAALAPRDDQSSSAKAFAVSPAPTIDFVYVKDVTAVCYYLFKNKVPSAIYNLGTGKARTFHDLVVATFNAMEKPVNIDWIDIPADIRDTYQYFTEAKMNKLFATGYTRPFYSLEEGVHDYVSNYLDNNYYL